MNVFAFYYIINLDVTTIANFWKARKRLKSPIK